jgi:hypothetical protein
MRRHAIRLYTCHRYTWARLAAALVLLASPASAQYQPRPLNDPATGEKYHIEATADLWFPTTQMVVASSGSGALSGLAGSAIDAKRDLGLTDQHLPQFGLILRPAKSHKFRFQYIPIKYTQSATLTQTLVFNGQRYNVGIPVNSTIDWKAFRFGYEYDFVTKNRGFVGFILEAKYTDVRVDLNSVIAREFAHARAPIPAIGGIGRFYVVPNISITGEVTGFKIPDSIDSRYNAHYVDVDIYATMNFTNNIGVQGGYRTLDVGYLIKTDSGAFTLKGLYFGGVLRY